LNGKNNPHQNKKKESKENIHFLFLPSYIHNVESNLRNLYIIFKKLKKKSSINKRLLIFENDLETLYVDVVLGFEYNDNTKTIRSTSFIQIIAKMFFL